MMDQNNKNYQIISEENIRQLPDDELARMLWNYHHIGADLRDEDGKIRADCLLVCGSNDLDVARKAAELYDGGEFKRVVMSGATVHKEFAELFHQDGITEAETFARVAMERGVPKEAIIQDVEAHNTLENIQYSTKLLDFNGEVYHDIVLVCCPSHERRALATANKVLPGAQIRVSSPDVSFDQYINNERYHDGRIKSLVGHTLRLALYGRKGDIEEQPLNPMVLDVYRELLSRGYSPLRYEAIESECKKYGLDSTLEEYERERIREEQALREDWEMGSGEFNVGRKVS